MSEELELTPEHAALQQSNAERRARLGLHGLNIDTNSIMVFLLVQRMIPDDAERMAFDLEFQTQLSETLDRAEEHLARIEIQRGVQTPQGLVVPGT